MERQCDMCRSVFPDLPVVGIEMWTSDERENWPVSKYPSKINLGLSAGLCSDCTEALRITIKNATNFLYRKKPYTYKNKEFSLLHKDMHNWWFVLDKLIESHTFTEDELQFVGRLRNELARATVSALLLAVKLEGLDPLPDELKTDKQITQVSDPKTLIGEILNAKT